MAKKSLKPQNPPASLDVWDAYLRLVSESFGAASSEFLSAKSHEPAILRLVSGRGDCYLYQWHRHPIVYRKPTYRGDLREHNQRLTAIFEDASSDPTNKSIRYHNEVEDFVGRCLVYPASIEPLLDQKPDLFACLKSCIDTVSTDAMESEALKISRP